MNRRSAGTRCTVNQRAERGISLIETLIAMVLGLLILAGVIQLMNQLVDGNTTTMKVARLEQDTRTVIDIIIQDLRRAGHFTEAVRDLGDTSRFIGDQPASPRIDGEPLQSGKTGSSISYAYRESDGKLIQGRFSHDAKAGTVLMHTGTASAAETITDPMFMTVTQISFRPTVSTAVAGAMKGQSTEIEIRIRARLKSDPTTERELADRIVLRTPSF